MSHIVEVQGTASCIEQRNTIDHHTTRESSGQNELSTCLSRIVTVLIEGYQAGHWHRCHFETEEEQEEVVGTYHHVHTQQGRDNQHIELTLLEGCVLTAQPLLSLYHHDEGTQSQDSLQYTGSRTSGVHAAKCLCSFCREDVEGDVSHHQETYQRIEPLTVCALGTAEVSNESDQQNYHQGSFWNHI